MAAKDDCDMDALVAKFKALAAPAGKTSGEKFQSSHQKKLMTECLGASYKPMTHQDVDAGVMGQMFVKEQKATGIKKANHFTINAENVDTFMDLVAVEYCKKKKMTKDEIKEKSPGIKIEMVGKIAGMSTEKKKMKVDETTKRMTDTSKYTGAHKERFDKDGQGKGIKGRADVHDNDGYVGNYKNKDTFDKK